MLALRNEPLIVLSDDEEQLQVQDSPPYGSRSDDELGNILALNTGAQALEGPEDLGEETSEFPRVPSSESIVVISDEDENEAQNQEIDRILLERLRPDPESDEIFDSEAQEYSARAVNGYGPSETQSPENQNDPNNADAYGSTVHLSENYDSNLQMSENNGSNVQMSESVGLDMDIDSDDEIAVLSKEEAERIGFKKTSFETAPQPQSVPLQPAYSQPAFNQPAPVYHAGANAAQTEDAQDRSVRQYFQPFSLPELQQHENNLSRQLSGLTSARDQILSAINELRNQVSTLGTDNVSLRSQLVRGISEKLDQAEDAIQRAKKVRNYLSILASVKDMKQYPQKYQYDYSKIGMPLMPGLFPVSTSVFDQYAAQPIYGQNMNPYMNPYAVSAPVNVDQVHLEQLFNDIYKEEDVKGMAPTPDSLKCQLFDHQRQGLSWLLKKEESKAGCILADDMGLGKTVQTIALIESNKSNEPNCKTTLIVGPVSLLRQWHAEISKKIKRSFALKVCLYIGKDRKRYNSFRHLRRFDVVLVSYSTLASEFKQHFAQAIEEAQVTKHQNVLPDIGSGGKTYRSPFYLKDAVFFRVVLDEAQLIKNKLSLTSKSAACLQAVHRLCLTGTPMQNNIDELYPILRFLRSKPYDDERKFKMDILVALKGNSEDVDDYEISQLMKKLRAVLLAIMLRRTKESKVDGKPLLQLPEKTIDLVYVVMESEEKEFYDNLEAGIQSKARKLMEASALSGNFLVLLLRLRQACIHQILVEVGEYGNEQRQKSSNMQYMCELVEDMMPEARKNVALLTEKANDVIDLDSEDEPELTCPICFDVAGADSIVIFSRCGHAICNGCVDDFFALSEDGGSTAPCVVCKRRVPQADLVDYSVFSKLTYEGYSVLEMARSARSNTQLTPSQRFAAVLGPKKKFSPSAKLEKTVELVEQITSDTPDEKIIVFSHFVITFDLLLILFDRKNIEYLRYDGSMNIDEKNEAVGKFYEGSARVLLLSLKAGNVGLTLTCANHVVLLDPFWNPYVEEQAMGRAHRLGQERPVKVYRLLIKNSVEDRITELQQRKKDLIGSAMDESALKSSSSLGRRELGYLFGLNTLQ